jgi:hypothetical protein
VRNKADAGPTLIIIGASGVAALRNLITDIEENARNDFRAGEECS